MTRSPKAIEAEIARLEAYVKQQRQTLDILEPIFREILNRERDKLKATCNALTELQHLRPSQ